MNFDLTDQQKDWKGALAARLQQEFRDQPPYSVKDPEAVRQWLNLFTSMDYYFRTGTDPGRIKLSPFSETLSGILLAGEVARVSPAACLALETSTRLFGWIISRTGTDQQVRKFLDPLQQGHWLGAVAMAESPTNFPDQEIKTEGRKEAQGYRVTGRKSLVINAPVAEYLAVTGKIDGQFSVFLIPSGTPGLVIGEPLPTLGFDQLAMADVTLDRCLVPEEHLIGPFPDSILFTELQSRTHLFIAAASLGLMEQALEGARKSACESQEGRKPLRAFQEIGFRLAEMFTLFQTAQWMLYRAAWLMETEAPEAHTTIAAAKIFITESAEEIARSAMQIAAGEGYLSGNVLEACFRNARFGPIAGETSEVLRMRIAEDCLAKYQSR